MIVLFHIICCIFSELSTPAWQNEVRQIAFQCVEAMEEAKYKILLVLWLTIDRSILLLLTFYYSHHFGIFCGGKKTCCEFIERDFFVNSDIDRFLSTQTLKSARPGPGK